MNFWVVSDAILNIHTSSIESYNISGNARNKLFFKYHLYIAIVLIESHLRYSGM